MVILLFPSIHFQYYSNSILPRYSQVFIPSVVILLSPDIHSQCSNTNLKVRTSVNENFILDRIEVEEDDVP